MVYKIPEEDIDLPKTEFVLSLPARLVHDRNKDVIDVRGKLRTGLLKHAGKDPKDLTEEQSDTLVGQVITSIILNAMRDGLNRTDQDLNNELVQALGDNSSTKKSKE